MAEKHLPQPRSAGVKGDCPLGGGGSTEARLEEAPGAGQERARKMTLPDGKPYSQVASSLALVQYRLVSVTHCFRSSNGY